MKIVEWIIRGFPVAAVISSFTAFANWLKRLVNNLRFRTAPTKEAKKPAKNINIRNDIKHVWDQFFKTRDQNSRNSLMEYYKPLIKYAAERLHSKLPDKVELDDLISAGIFGLMDAIDAYDPERGVKFETYCSPRIRGSILDELRSMDWVPGLIRTHVDLLTKDEKDVPKTDVIKEKNHDPLHPKATTYGRFTHRARKVIALSNQEARRLNHEYIGTEHILLGLVKESIGVGATVLKNLGLDMEKLRIEVEKQVKRGHGMVTMSKLHQTPRVKKVVEYANEEARALNHNYVNTEHILLGLLRETNGVAVKVLMNWGLKLEYVRQEVLILIGEGGEPP